MSEPNMTSGIVSLRNENAVLKEELEYFNKIYHEENLLADSSTEYRYEQRLAKVKPLLDEFFAWLETVLVSGMGKLTDAVRYALNERKSQCYHSPYLSFNSERILSRRHSFCQGADTLFCQDNHSICQGRMLLTPLPR